MDIKDKIIELLISDFSDGQSCFDNYCPFVRECEENKCKNNKECFSKIYQYYKESALEELSNNRKAN